MSPRDEIVGTLRNLEPELRGRFKVSNIGLFGSFVRGEVRGTSDIDVLVDFADDAGMFDLVRLGLFLEEHLGRKVDVVPRASLRNELREAILDETVAI